MAAGCRPCVALSTAMYDEAPGVGARLYGWAQILRIYISSETDLNFLHTLEVSEEDFQSLKLEQGILVDFASFPGKIISLLEKCSTAQPADSPRSVSVRACGCGSGRREGFCPNMFAVPGQSMHAPLVNSMHGA